MREWVDELTGRSDRAASGLRVPAESEISQLMSMFPDMRREDVVGALQRRCEVRLVSVVRRRLTRNNENLSFSPNIETAVETLLASHT